MGILCAVRHRYAPGKCHHPGSPNYAQKTSFLGQLVPMAHSRFKLVQLSAGGFALVAPVATTLNAYERATCHDVPRAMTPKTTVVDCSATRMGMDGVSLTLKASLRSIQRFKRSKLCAMHCHALPCRGRLLGQAVCETGSQEGPGLAICIC